MCGAPTNQNSNSKKSDRWPWGFLRCSAALFQAAPLPVGPAVRTHRCGSRLQIYPFSGSRLAELGIEFYIFYMFYSNYYFFLVIDFILSFHCFPTVVLMRFPIKAAPAVLDRTLRFPGFEEDGIAEARVVPFDLHRPDFPGAHRHNPPEYNRSRIASYQWLQKSSAEAKPWVSHGDVCRFWKI